LTIPSTIGLVKNPADALSYCPDYHIDPNNPGQPTQFKLEFHMTYPNEPNYLSNIKLSLSATTSPDNLYQRICNTYYDNGYLNVTRPKEDHDDWTLEDNLWQYKGKIYVSDTLYTEVIMFYHDMPLADHFGRDRTLELIWHKYWWRSMVKTVVDYTKACQLYAQNKLDTHTTYGTLLPLTPPSGPWQQIGIYLITDLPTTKKTHFDCILVVIDHFIKIGHFAPC